MIYRKLILLSLLTIPLIILTKATHSFSEKIQQQKHNITVLKKELIAHHKDIIKQLHPFAKHLEQKIKDIHTSNQVPDHDAHEEKQDILPQDHITPDKFSKPEQLHDKKFQLQHNLLTQSKQSAHMLRSYNKITNHLNTIETVTNDQDTGWIIKHLLRRELNKIACTHPKRRQQLTDFKQRLNHHTLKKTALPNSPNTQPIDIIAWNNFTSLLKHLSIATLIPSLLFSILLISKKPIKRWWKKYNTQKNKNYTS